MEELYEPKCPKIRAVFVYWLDAKAGSQWESADSIPDVEHCYTQGFLTGESPDAIRVSSTLDSTGDEHNAFIAIPKGMIRALVYLPDGMLDELLQYALKPSDA